MSTDRNRRQKLTTADVAEAGREGPPPIEDRPRDMPSVERMERQSVDEPAIALFQEGELRQLRERWMAIQTAFVDEPRQAVQDADSLVASTIQRLAESFANGRAHLERQWDRGQDVSTEDLRQSLTRYRSFFHRLLAM